VQEILFSKQSISAPEPGHAYFEGSRVLFLG